MSSRNKRRRSRLVPLVAIEGLDGSGKSTLVSNLLNNTDYEFMQEIQNTNLYTGKSESVSFKDICGYYLDKEPLSHFFAAAFIRSLKPYRNVGKWAKAAISDRSCLSTIVYQILAVVPRHKTDFGNMLISFLKEHARRFAYFPSFIVFLDVSYKIAKERVASRKHGFDTMEAKIFSSQSTFNKYRAYYKQALKLLGAPYVIVNTDNEDTFKVVSAILKERYAKTLSV